MSRPTIPVDLILSKLTEDVEKTQTRIQKASDVLFGDLKTEIAQTPYEVVHEIDRVKLKHYCPVTESQCDTPLLAIYALVNRETMLDLQSDRSVVKTFLNHGINLYMIDWGYPTRKDRFQTIGDHVNEYIGGMVDFIRKRHRIDRVNILGICMGGTFSVIYAALHPDKVKNLVTTVTPTHFDIDTGLLNIWMKSLNVDQLVDTFANIPGDFLNFTFLLLNPARLMVDKYVGFLNNMDNRDFVENFIRMEKWIFDSPDVPGETFRQFCKDCFQNNLLIQNQMEIDGKRVDLRKITAPLLNFYSKYDHLVPPEACDKLTAAVGSKDTMDVCLETGHVGIYVSSKCQETFAPEICEWLKSRDKAKPKRGGKKNKKSSNKNGSR